MSARLRFAPLALPPPSSGGAAEGFVLRSEGDWLAIVDPAPVRDDPLPCRPGGAGPWRVVPDGPGLARVCDLPLLHGVQEALPRLLEWAAATRDGEVPAGWTPPPREDLDGGSASARLRVRAGAHLARGELVCAPGRLALVFAELASVPADLAPARRAWLEALLLDAQRRWHLVRLGLDARARVRAEVDLSGVPAPWARPFVQLSLAALARAVEWVLPSVAFLVDPGAPSGALERPPTPSKQEFPT